MRAHPPHSGRPDVPRTTRPVRIVWLALVLAGVTACAPFGSLWRKPPSPPPPPPAAPPAPPPELPLAEATHRFIVAPDQDVVGWLQVTIARASDTLPDIARRFNVGFEEIVRANPGVDPWLPKEGTPIILPTEFVLPDAPREGLVLNLAAMRVFYFPKREKGAPVEVITHPVGIGKIGWATPEGATRVTARVRDPVWIPPVSVRREHERDGDILPPRVPAGPDNPLGRHMLRLDWPSYLIHGTNKPPGVGMRASHGCIRLYPEDIARLYDHVPVGTRVTVVNQPFLLGWRDGRAVFQSFPPLADDQRDWSDVPRALRRRAAQDKALRWKRIAAQTEMIDWPAVAAAAGRPQGLALPVGPGGALAPEAALAAAPRVRNALPQGASWDGNEDQYGTN